MPYVLYRRVSTQDQGRSRLGLDAQDRDLELFLTNYASEDAEVLASYTDILSGFVDVRPELQKALELCRETGATLLVSKLDRLSRKVSYIAQLMDEKGLEFRVAQMPHADKFQLHIYAALAEQERDFISKRTKAALASAKEKGVKLGGLRPGTEARNRAAREKAQREAQRVFKLIRPLRDDAGMTWDQIASYLNESGLKASQGGLWHGTSARNAYLRCTVQANSA